MYSRQLATIMMQNLDDVERGRVCRLDMMVLPLADTCGHFVVNPLCRLQPVQLDEK